MLNAFLKASTSAHISKPLPEGLSRLLSVYAKGLLKERVFSKLADMVKVSFALGDEAAEASQNIRIGNLGLLHVGNAQTCVIKVADAGTFHQSKKVRHDQ